MGRPWALALCALMTACAAGDGQAPTTPATTTSPAPPKPPSSALPVARLVFVGDVMLGRQVAPVVAGDPGSVFERLRPAVVGADMAFANLESPLTTRPHAVGPYALEAGPSSATLLAGAGFDVLDLANNHAGDAGPATVGDTIQALDDAGLLSVGAGADADAAEAPLMLDANGVTVGVLAFDLSGGTGATTTSPGVNTWDTARAHDAVTDLRQRVDVLVVGLHGGAEYLKRPDPALARLVDEVAGWGVDVVWGHGAHAAYPVDIADGSSGRRAVVAPGLGNALFDQRLPGTDIGGLLEVLVDSNGVIAMRDGMIRIDAGRSAFDGWHDPPGDAVALNGEWWSPVRPWTAATPPAPLTPGDVLPDGYQLVAAAVGDVTGSGVVDTVVSYRRPATDHPVHGQFPDIDWVDGAGRSAHIAVYLPDGQMRWGSAFLFQPIAGIAACTGALAVTYSTLDSATVVAGGAWTWDGFGFITSPSLAGSATVACADIDHDGRPDAVLADRTPRDHSISRGEAP